MATSPIAVTQLPVAPTTASPADFDVKADAFLGALPVFGTQLNNLATTTYNNAVEANTAATTASTAATTAASGAGSPKWVSGQIYNQFAVVMSGVSPYDIFRKTTASSSSTTTDPSLDPTNWLNISSLSKTGGTVTGNVGIGVSTIKGRLHIGGAISSDVTLLANNSLTIDSYSTSLGYISSIGFGATSGATYNTAYIALRSSTQGSFGYGDLVFGTRSGTADTAPTERMRIDSIGNLGIGTASPLTKLHVSSGSSGGATFTGNYGFSAANYNIRLINDGTSYGYIGQAPNVGGISISAGMRYYGTGSWTADTASASAITMNEGSTIFLNNTGLTASGNFTPTERMRVDASGMLNVGNTKITNSFTILGNTTSTTTVPVGQGNGGAVVIIRGADISGTAFCAVYALAIRVSGGDANQVLSATISRAGSTTPAFTFGTSGGFVTITPANNGTLAYASFLGL